MSTGKWHEHRVGHRTRIAPTRNLSERSKSFSAGRTAAHLPGLLTRLIYRMKQLGITAWSPSGI